MTPTEIAVFVLVVAVGSATQAITGFGFGLVALGLLGWWMELREASVLLAPAGLAMNALIFLRLRRHFTWTGLGPLAVAGLVAVPLGGLVLLHVSLRWLELALAAVMFASAAQGLRRRRDDAPRTWHPVTAGVPCGFVGGLLTGAYGIGGPPVVSYLLNRPLDRFQFIAATQALFGVAAVVRVTQFVWLGQIGREHLPLVLPAVAGAAAGVTVGVHLLHRMSDRRVRQIVLWFVVACGARYLWAALA
ncbi:MAG: sulfite exporter TauE/SafE family protein [Opitutaceae bacterium]|nr:sulfite exporter TauE/SafE family protein [Opitutaceae bacterium]